jgi:phosphatidylserine/phosphatidylglycerophosphate/cardiolipin synthase-like enzyme
VVSAALLALVVGAGAAVAYAPPNGGVFNNPRGGFAAKWRVITTVNHAIQHAPRGSTIMISNYLFDAKSSADALIGAHRRGVHVQIVFDRKHVHSAQSRRVARAMNHDNKPGQPIPARWGKDDSFVVFCDGSCRGGPHNDHAKFYVFTKTGTASNVVMVSSSNLNRGGAVGGWNDLYVAKGRPALVHDYAVVHAEMSQDKPAANRYREYHDGPYTARFYPKPSGPDPVLQDMNKIHCHGATGGAGRGGRTAVNVSMFAWNNTRGVKTARKLIALNRDGCDVSVIYGAPSRQVRDILMNSARHGGIKLWDSRMNLDSDPQFDVRVHHKYMLINGNYGTDSSSWRVHTGSQNWGRGTLRGGDENTLTIATRRAYAQYIRNWDTVANHSRRIS